MSAAAGGVSAAAAAQGAEVGGDVQLSCGSHTDYGLLTLVLQQPGISALQVGCRMPVTGRTAQPAHGACPQHANCSTPSRHWRYAGMYVLLL
jgi:hypothetical protein